MLSRPVIQLSPSASHSPHSSSPSSSIHSPTVLPRIFSQGSSSLVKFSPHLSQRLHQPLPREIKKTPPRRAGIFIKCIPPPLLTSSSGGLFSRSGLPNGYGEIPLSRGSAPFPRHNCHHSPRRYQ